MDVRTPMDVLMSAATLLVITAHAFLMWVSYGPLHGMAALVLGLAVMGDMVLAHWQRRRPWWARW